MNFYNYYNRLKQELYIYRTNRSVERVFFFDSEPNYFKIKRTTILSLLIGTILVVTFFSITESTILAANQKTKIANEARLESAIKDIALYQPDVTLYDYNQNAEHVIIVDKSRETIYVANLSDSNYKINRQYSISIGSKVGDKQQLGDLKTPEGVYKIVAVLKGDRLDEQYGPRAYVLNYPNRLDRVYGKTGSGIWIHGSGLGSKTDKTRGCVELNDFDIVEIEEYAKTGVPVYIFPARYELPIVNNQIAKELITPQSIYKIKKLHQAS
ncbi:MAG: L,D-transpeptidase family protein [Nitrospinota bacterium]